MSGSEITVALATPADTADLVSLHGEMFEYHGFTPYAPGSLEEQIEREGPGGNDSSRFLLARSGGVAAGLIVFSDFFVVGAGRTAFMQDLFVASAYRRAGVGRSLMLALSRLAIEEDWIRVDWRVERLNLDARVFYDLLGPDSFQLHKLSYRLNRSDLERIAAL